MRSPQKRYTAEQTRTFQTKSKIWSCLRAGLHIYSASELQTWTVRKRSHEDQTCCDEHVVQSESVVGRRQIADDGERQRRRPGRNSQRGSSPVLKAAETTRRIMQQ